MIIGIGTDICDIRRIEALLEKFETRFKNKVFTKYEQSYADGQSNPAHTYAKRFAGKEAVAKALASPETGSLSWKDVEIINHPSGQPGALLHGGALARVHPHLNADKSYKVHISLSDDYPYAQAFAIFEIS